MKPVIRETWESDPLEAQAAGAIFYELPTKIKDQNIDSLILPIVRKINESRWVWTGESCQGHPDDTTGMTAWGSPRPFLRLIVRRENLGVMLERLMEADHEINRYVEWGCRAQNLLIYPQFHGEDWVTIYLHVEDVQTAYQRNKALFMLMKFAEKLGE